MGDGERAWPMFQRLLELKIDPKAKNHGGFNILHLVAANGQGSYGKGNRHFYFNLFRAPEYGIDIDEPNNYGVRPLHLAATVSEFSVMSLLDLGADP